MIFPAAKLDRSATLITISVIAFLVALAVLFILKVPHGWIWALSMMLIPGISYALSPKQYVFDGSHIIIEKVIGKRIVISIQDIEDYNEIADFSKLKISKTFGNGGLFGFYGIFSTAEYGTINCQLTSMKNVIVMKSHKGIYAISPEDPVSVCAMLNAAVVRSEGNVLKPAKPRSISQAHPAILIIPVIIFALTAVAIILAYRSLPDQIAVHFNVYGQPDRWGSKLSFLYNGLIPSGILFLLNCCVFLFVRRTSHNPAIPKFLVIIIGFLQLFTAYIQLDMYWLNTHDHHMMPFVHSLVAFVAILGILLFVYYRIVTKTTK